MKRLALFLDGTWNDPDDETNVHALSQAVTHGDMGDVTQLSFYGKGVGTRWYNRIRGGTLGAGLSENVRDAYAWLVANYSDGDEIFLFGFSRGAYTARSVAGVIIKCGLLRDSARLSVADVYERYQQGKKAKPLYELEFLGSAERAALPAADRLLLDYSARVPIKMVGVWDTVGALGVPWTEMPLLGRGNFYFHNTNLSVLIEHAYHALALDEFRGPYKPTLWTRFIPEKADTLATTSIRAKVEQRWFIGAHSNVGGGYANDRLKTIPLAWLQQRAEACGLKFSRKITCTGDEHRTEPTDSYSKFLMGAYRALRFGRRFYRPVCAERREVKGGWSEPINETIDASVFRRWQEFEAYRPVNLREWAERKGIDLGSHRGDWLPSTTAPAVA